MEKIKSLIQFLLKPLVKMFRYAQFVEASSRRRMINRASVDMKPENEDSVE